MVERAERHGEGDEENGMDWDRLVMQRLDLGGENCLVGYKRLGSPSSRMISQ